MGAPTRLGLAGWGLVSAAAAAILVSRAALIGLLHPALYSPEEMQALYLGADVVASGAPWEALRELLTDREALGRYQYTHYAGGALVVALLHVPLALALGPGAISLKLVAAGLAGLAGGLWTAAAWREAGPRAGLLMALAASAATPYLAFRQATALGNHAELGAWIGLGAVLLQWAPVGPRGRALRALSMGALAGFGTWFDWPFAAFVAAAGVVWLSERPRLGEVAAVAGGIAIGIAPMFWVLKPDAPPPWAFDGGAVTGVLSRPPAAALRGLAGDLLRVPALSPMDPRLTWSKPAIYVPLWLGALLGIARGGAARACGLFAFTYLVLHALSGFGGPHRQTPMILPLLFCGAIGLADPGRGRIARGLGGLAALATALHAGLAAWDARGFDCRGNLATARSVDSLTYTRRQIYFYTPEMVEDLNRMVHLAPKILPDPGGIHEWFQLSAGASLVFYWRYIDAISPEGTIAIDACMDRPEPPIPSPAERAAHLDPGWSTEYAEGAGWGLAIRAGGDGAQIDAAIEAAPPSLREGLARGVGVAAACGGVDVAWSPDAALAGAARGGAERCGE